METFFEVVAGFYDGGYMDTYAYASRYGAVEKAEQLRASVTATATAAPAEKWSSEFSANEDGIVQIIWNSGQRYVCVGERVMHA